jgi:hypothetical protein
MCSIIQRLVCCEAVSRNELAVGLRASIFGIVLSTGGQARGKQYFGCFGKCHASFGTSSDQSSGCRVSGRSPTYSQKRKGSDKSQPGAESEEAEALRVRLRKVMASPRGLCPSPVGSVRARGGRCVPPLSHRPHRSGTACSGAVPRAAAPLPQPGRSAVRRGSPTAHSPPLGHATPWSWILNQRTPSLTLFGALGSRLGESGRKGNSKGEVSRAERRKKVPWKPPLIGSPGGLPLAIGRTPLAESSAGLTQSLGTRSRPLLVRSAPWGRLLRDAPRPRGPGRDAERQRRKGDKSAATLPPSPGFHASQRSSAAPQHSQQRHSHHVLQVRERGGRAASDLSLLSGPV